MGSEICIRDGTKSRVTLLAIVAPFVLFFLAGRYLIDVEELPKVNKGQLLVPHIDMASLNATDSNEQPYDGNDMSTCLLYPSHAAHEETSRITSILLSTAQN